MVMPGRQFGELGRFGFNGKEQDPEVKVDGTQYDYGFRIYDPMLSRFLSVDPLTKSYPWYTPYQFSGNKPIAFVDPDGKEDKWYMVEILLDNTNTKIEKIGLYDVGTISFNNGPRQPLPQGPNGKGIQFNIYLWSWSGNSAQPQEFVLFVPAQKSGWKKLIENLDNLAKGSGGDHQSGGIVMTKDLEDQAKAAGIDGLLPSSDFADVVQNADKFLDMLGGTGVVETTSIRDLSNPNKPWNEKLISLIKVIKENFEQADRLNKIGAELPKGGTEPINNEDNTVRPATIRDTNYAPPTGVRRDPNTGEVNQWQQSETVTIPSNDPKKPDTIRTTINKKPKR